MKIIKIIIAVALAGLLSSCETTRVPKLNAYAPIDRDLLKQRYREISNEPTGNFYIGRRYFIPKTQFWGYLRKPRQQWTKSKLVIMNERITKTPDRIEEWKKTFPSHGYDHNYEYRVYGRFSGNEAYAPNINSIIPEFIPTRFELINKNPGFLFRPDEVYSTERLPRR